MGWAMLRCPRAEPWERAMQSKKSALKFLAKAVAALVFILVLVISASVDAG